MRAMVMVRPELEVEGAEREGVEEKRKKHLLRTCKVSRQGR